MNNNISPTRSTHAYAALKNLLSKLNQTTGFIEDLLLILILAGMILLAGSQILLRNYWDAGLAWGDPLLRVAVLWVGLLGAMAATRDNNHIKIDILYRFLPGKAKHISRVVTDLFTASVCAIIAYYATQLVIMEKQDGVMAFSNVPSWVCELIIPFGFGIMALRFYLNFLMGVVGILRPSSNSLEANK